MDRSRGLTTTIVFAVVFLALVGGGVAFLSGYTIPAPSGVVEVVIPNDRFGR